MMNRKRTTWAAADRRASAPPANPGYGLEDQDHPAHQPDPAHEQYAKGDPSAWAEDVHRPFPPEANPPAVPGYDEEDQDHPAHKRPPRVPKEATLRQMVEKKAHKCLRLARLMAGKTASQTVIENNALDLMDLPDSNLDAMLARHAGGFLAEEEEEEQVADVFDDGFMDEPVLEDPFMDEPVLEDPFDDGMGDSGLNNLYAMMRQMQAKLNRLAKKAEDDEVEAEDDEVEAEDEVKKEARRLFASLDRDRDGFITAQDWANKALFASLDTDGDGIIAADEFVSGFAPDEVEADDFGMYAELDESELALLRAFDDEDDESGKKAHKAKKARKAKKAEDEEAEDDESDKKAHKAKKARKAKKAEEVEAEDDEVEAEDDEVDAEEVEAEDDEVEAGKKASDDEDEDESEDDGSDDDDDDGEDEEFDKEASAFFACGEDPMGLSEEPVVLSDEDEALLADIFGDGLPHQASQVPKQASLKPKAKKPSTGVKTLGNLSRTASSKSSVDELSKLWESAPDVRKVFGM